MEKDTQKANVHKERGEAIISETSVADLTKEQFEKAEPEFRKVLEYNPDDVEARMFLAMCLGHKGKIDEIVRLLEEIIQLDPNNIAHADLGRIYDYQGRYAEAAREYKESLRVYKKIHDKMGFNPEFVGYMITSILLGKPADKVADWPDIKTRLAEIQNWPDNKTGLAEIQKESNEKSGCFIATAAYGTPYNKEINVLRKFRDNNMLSNDFGKCFVRIYYRYSPLIATIISKSPKMRALVRFLLQPIILIVKQIK